MLNQEVLMASSLIVELSQRVTRTLDLGKGMFFDADAMAVLVECGAFELIQKAAAEHLKERIADRQREPAAAAGEPDDYQEPAGHRNRGPGHKPFGGSSARKPRSIGASTEFESADESGKEVLARVRRKLENPPTKSSEGKEALERARRTLGGQSKRRTDNVTVLRPRQRG